MTNIIANNSDQTEEHHLPQLMLNTADLNDEDLQDFVNISEEMARTRQERHSLKKLTKSPANTIVATLTRIEIYETVVVDDDQILKALKPETSCVRQKDCAGLRSSKKLMKYLDADVKIRDERLCKSSPIKKTFRGKVATAQTVMASPAVKRKAAAKVIKANNNTQDLRKKYESSMEGETTPSPKAKDSAKSIKLKRKTKVKQLALLFNNNNMNSVIRNSSTSPQTPEPRRTQNCVTLSSPTFTSTLKPKLPKFEQKFSTGSTKLPNSQSKSLPKTSSISSLTDTSVVNNEELQKHLGTACLVAEDIFSQLPVKAKALLYNKFIDDMAEQNAKFSKHAQKLSCNGPKETPKGEVVFEKQKSVKNLRAKLEAKLATSKPLSITLQLFRKSTSKSALDNS